MMKNTEAAFRWIIGILNSHHIPYQISGGFAAKIYGSSRPLNDIDIDIPDEYFPLVYEEVKDYLVYGPDWYADSKFESLLMTLFYKGQEMDITGATSGRMSDYSETTWLPYPCDFNNVTYKEVYGIEIPVIPRERLVAYKKEMKGDNHVFDLQAISSSGVLGVQELM